MNATRFISQKNLHTDNFCVTLESLVLLPVRLQKVTTLKVFVSEQPQGGTF